MPITFIEVCAGCGGLSTGLIEAGLVPLALNELDKTCCATLSQNHPNAPIINGDFRDITSPLGQLDVLVGGVPCQSFSSSGKRKGLEDPRGDLILEFARLVTRLQPKGFLIENVKGLITHNKGATLQEVLTKLSCSGAYTVTYKVLNAVDYEVPQKRERLFIFGVREGTPHPHSLFGLLSPRPHRTLRDALDGVEISPGAAYSSARARVLDLVPPGGCWVDLPPDIQTTYMGKALTGGRRGYAKRLSWDKPAPTLTTSPAQKQTERCHPDETRPLTLKEYARIQTFPDAYVFVGSTASIYRQIGNAVPPRLGYHLGRALVEYFGDVATAT
jgi:DNA (cytosine-5)-methyltransferase 1